MDISENSKSASLDLLIESIIDRLDREETVEREKVIADHPEYSAQLRQFFDDYDLFQSLVKSPDSNSSMGQLLNVISPLSQYGDTPFRRLIQITSSANEPCETESVGGSPEDDLTESVRIGNYKLLEKIGEGGMGEVWMAEQVSPINRRVAVKLIRSGRESKSTLARFEAERQALALMDHENIARIYDADVTRDGRPYFVMELIRGEPITAYCDRNELSIEKRIELFVPVCRAVHDAHQKGVIHRDLKPSNILIAPHDGAPRPKIIDFGLAKALQHQRLTEKTLYTRFGEVVGTLWYMSPEQAEENNLDIDTRSDIYSLGAVLYELLTGTTPIEKQTGQPMATLLNSIKNVDPPTPSRRLSSSTRALPSVSKARQTDEGKLAGLLRGDLDWVVMKAIEKDRTRRYETALDMARELESFLKKEPVSARPPTMMYRTSRFVRRQPLLVGAATTILLVILAGIAVSSWMAWRADSARKLAVQRQERLKEQLEIFLDVFKDLDPEVSVSELALRDEIGRNLVSTADSIVNSGIVEPDRSKLLAYIGRTLASIGLPSEAIDISQLAYDFAMQNSDMEAKSQATIALAAARNGANDFQITIDLLDEKIDEVMSDPGLSVQDRYGLLNMHAHAKSEVSGQRDAARSMYLGMQRFLNDSKSAVDPVWLEQKLAICDYKLALIEVGKDDWENHIQSLRDANSRIVNAFGADSVTTIQMHRGMAQALGSRGMYEEAKEYAEKAVKSAETQFGKANFETALSLNVLVSTCGRASDSVEDSVFRRRLVEVLPIAEESLELLVDKLKLKHPVAIQCLANIGTSYALTGDIRKGIQLRRQAFELAEEYHGRNSRIAQQQLWGLAIALKHGGKSIEATDLIREYVEFCEKEYGEDSEITKGAKQELSLLETYDNLFQSPEKNSPENKDDSD